MLSEGIHAGLRQLGFAPRAVGYVERDAYAAATLLARMEAQAMEPAPVWAGNLQDVRWEQWNGVVDCVAAGFPCQPHSMAGSRKGTADDRWIWPAIADCIRRVGPWLVVLENVSGLRSSGGMSPVLADLAALGFRVEWDSIRASDVGASHQRERVFIVAYRAEHRRKQGRPESARIERRHDAAECDGEVGNATSQRLREERQCRFAREPGACEHGSELADTERSSRERRRDAGDMESQSRDAEGEAREWEWSGNAADGSRGVLADSCEPRRQGRKQLPAHDQDGRTDGRSKNHADQLPNFVIHIFYSHQDPTMSDGLKSSESNPGSPRRRLNPNFAEWIMGWPMFWTVADKTACGASEMALWRYRLDSQLSRLLADSESKFT